MTIILSSPVGLHVIENVTDCLLSLLPTDKIFSLQHFFMKADYIISHSKFSGKNASSRFMWPDHPNYKRRTAVVEEKLNCYIKEII